MIGSRPSTPPPPPPAAEYEFIVVSTMGGNNVVQESLDQGGKRGFHVVAANRYHIVMQKRIA